jgi:DNA-binding CsgD family transcriptional regulator
VAAAAAQHLVRSGRQALAVADWQRARSCFEQAYELDPGPEVLGGLSQALQFTGDFDRAIELGERAFAACLETDRRVQAAGLARRLAFLHMSVRGNLVAANGWMASAARALERVAECVAHGWLALDRAPWTNDASERERHATTALEIARRFGDRELEIAARALLGETYVAGGRVSEGMTLLDEAMAAGAAGAVGFVPMGEIYCRLLRACEQATDVRRAAQWMTAAAGFDAWRDFVPPMCRTHYGGILIAIGRWPEAEAELVAAIRTFARGHRAGRVFPLVRLAELRVRQGRFEEARQLLEESEWHPTARQVLATIALRVGDLALAEDLTRLRLEGEDPLTPACAPLLDLLIDIHVARGDPGAARQALGRLTELAGRAADDRIRACAEFATGRVCTAEADAAARAHLRIALERFSILGLPLEAARAQLELARASAGTASAAAVAEARLALRTFERLGAARDADAAAAVLKALGASGRAWPKRYGTLTKRETEVLALLAAGCSNAAIGARLFISRRTAEHHVANILSKLDLHSRAEAAAYAVREAPGRPVAE